MTKQHRRFKMNESKVIYEFRKSTGQKVVCQFREYKRNKLIDLRVFYDAGDGNWRPTPKGISLRRELIPELKEAVDKAATLWEAELPGEPGDDESIREDG
jgi:hypothetical protein